MITLTLIPIEVDEFIFVSAVRSFLLVLLSFVLNIDILDDC